MVVISNFGSLEAAPSKSTALGSCLVCLGLNSSPGYSCTLSLTSALDGVGGPLTSRLGPRAGLGALKIDKSLVSSVIRTPAR